MNLQYVLDDRTAKVMYQIFGNGSITRNEAIYLVQEGLFESARQTGLHPDSELEYEFVNITPPDGWHKPESGAFHDLPEEMFLNKENSWSSLSRGQAGLPVMI